MQVLIVDDSMVARNIVKNGLLPMGCQVLQAANGQEALELLKNEAERTALVLLDWNMPILNGFDTLKAIRKMKRCRHIRILMVSTESEDEFVDLALEAGADGYLAKPFTAEELMDKVAATINGAGSK